jgi:hypothetical protein
VEGEGRQLFAPKALSLVQSGMSESPAMPPPPLFPIGSQNVILVTRHPTAHVDRTIRAMANNFEGPLKNKINFLILNVQLYMYFMALSIEIIFR